MRLAALILEFFVFFKSLFSSEYAQCNVCRRVIGLFIQQRNLWCVWFMIRARRLNLEETAISSTCVRLIARPVVQHTCIITPKIINIRNRKYYFKKHMRLFLLTFLILISNSGVETWHIIHLSHSTSFLLFLGLEGQSLSRLPNCDISRIKNVSYELVL